MCLQYKDYLISCWGGIYIFCLHFVQRNPCCYSYFLKTNIISLILTFHIYRDINRKLLSERIKTILIIYGLKYFNCLIAVTSGYVYISMGHSSILVFLSYFETIMVIKDDLTTRAFCLYNRNNFSKNIKIYYESSLGKFQDQNMETGLQLCLPKRGSRQTN